MNKTKALKYFFTFVLTVSFLIFNACANEDVFDEIYTKVILKNTAKSIHDIKELIRYINQKDEVKAKEKFSDLVFSWKSVESLYMLGDFDEQYTDTPRYIDFFHHSNEDIKSQLDFILNSKQDLENILYKNSHKSINALEYLLFKKEIRDEKVNKALKIVTSNILYKLESIEIGYIDNKEAFSEYEEKTSSSIMSVMLNSIYALKEWRIAAPLGITAKYKGVKNQERAEYYISKNSSTAIKAILETHKSILNSADMIDFGDYIKGKSTDINIKKANALLQEALGYVASIRNDNLTDDNLKNLYTTLNKLFKTYNQITLYDLYVNAKVIDGDGD